MKALHRTILVFYFEKSENLELVLKRALWDFNNSLLIVKKCDPGMCPSQLNFDYSSLWMQIHDLPLNWRKKPIIVMISEEVGQVSEVNHFFCI